jgi:hypothetical protein
MVYAVDFVLDVMRDMSASEPQLFQRDRSLYVVSEKGFGQVAYGLPTEDMTEEEWRDRNPRIENMLKKGWNSQPRRLGMHTWDIQVKSSY